MFFIFVHFDDVLIPSMTWNDLFWNCTDNKNKWRHFFNLFVPPLNRSYQFYSWTVSISFASQMIWNTGKIIAEVRSYIIKWCCRCRRRIRRLSSLMSRLIRVFAGWKIVAIAILANLPGKMSGSVRANLMPKYLYHTN